MTTTILGANGKIGAILSRYARQTGASWRTQARAMPADVIWSAGFDGPNANDVFVEGGTIINMIGATQGDEQALHDINVRFVADLLAKAAQAGIAHVILASTAAVYGAGNEMPFLETSPLQPLSPYGKSKAAMETVARAFDHNCAPAITILRIGNVAGADALLAATHKHIAQSQPVPLHRFADGTSPVRSYIGPHDLGRVVHALTAPHKGPPRIINVAHPQPITLEEMLTGYQNHILPDLVWYDTPALKEALPIVTLSTKALQMVLDFENYANPSDAFAAQVAEYQW